jgi:hypothetical protein
MDALGLKKRVAFGKKIQEIRNISPRTMQFMQWWKDRAQAMLHVGGSSRKKMEKEMGILDGEMQSRWNRLHSEGGAVDVLVDTFNAMAELRMKVQYGDYLGYACKALKTEDMATMKWKVDKLNWQATAERILEEEARREEEEGRWSKPLSPTPFADDVIKAAEKLGCDPRLVRYQILQYAARKNNDKSHSGIGEMIEEARFRELADAIVEDKRALGVVFRGRPGEEIQMRNIIVKIEKEWFVKLFVHETSHGKVNQYIPTVKHIETLERMANRFQDP